MTERLLISQGEACRRLGVSRPTLIAEIRAGRLRYVLIGKRRKFTATELAAYVERQARGWNGTEAWSPAITRTKDIDFESALALTRRRVQAIALPNSRQNDPSDGSVIREKKPLNPIGGIQRN